HRALAVLDRAVGNPDLEEDGLEEVRSLLESTGARALVEKRAERLGERVARRLARTELDAHAGEQLLGLLHSVAGTRAAALTMIQ
ncbi:polyprenyl synthetase family protein, partial [Streptomyces sp. SID7982]|nr:polyprenyl synthetase family protein [Streptomyces sp. SID7982]